MLEWITPGKKKARDKIDEQWQMVLNAKGVPLDIDIDEYPVESNCKTTNFLQYIDLKGFNVKCQTIIMFHLAVLNWNWLSFKITHYSCLRITIYGTFDWFSIASVKLVKISFEDCVPLKADVWSLYSI